MTSTPAASRTNPSLKKGVLWSLLGSAASLLGSWGIMLALIHVGSPTLVGQYGIAMAIGAPVMAFASLQLRGLQATDARREFRFGDYLGLRLVSATLAMIVIVFLAPTSGQGAVVIVTAVLLGLRTGVLSISDVFYGFFQQHERMDKIAQGTVLTHGVTLIAFTVALFFTYNLVVAAACAALASTVPLLVHNLPNARSIMKASEYPLSLRPYWTVPRLRMLFIQAAPLAVVSLLISLNANIPRYFFAGADSLDQLGVFVALFSLLIATETVVQAVSLTISPRLAKLYLDDDRRSFIALLCRVEVGALIATLVGVGTAAIAGPLLVSLIYEPRYAEEPEAIIWLAVAAGLGLFSRFVANAITAVRRLKIQVVNNAIGVVVLTLACMILIPLYGISGGMAAVAASAAARLVLNSLVCIRFLLDWTPSEYRVSRGTQ